MNIPRSQTPSQRRATLLFTGSQRNYGSGPGCRLEYAGPMPANGGPSRVCLGLRSEDRQRATYRHFAKVRLKKTDQVVAVCGNPRCLDRRHLHVIPDSVQPKPSRVPPADAAEVPPHSE